MSAWDDPIPTAGRARINLVEALSIAHHVPAEALALALLTPERIAADVVGVVELAAGGAEIGDRQRNLLYWGVHVLGAAGRPAIFQPLLRLLRHPPEDLEDWLEPALSGMFPKILISAFDGDAEALRNAILDPETDEIARLALFKALAFLTWEGRIDEGSTRAFLVRFDEERPVRAGEAGWDGWEAAIALLAMRDLAPRVLAAHADARLLGDPDLFETLLALGEAAPDDTARWEAARLGYIEDLVAEIDDLLSDDEDEAFEPGEPVRNPLRDVGRNDPCPCGSGKKFKKCCLAP